VVSRFACLLSLVACLSSASALAEMSENRPGQSALPLSLAPSLPRSLPFSFIAGSAIFRGNPGVALALRRQLSADSCSLHSVRCLTIELGGVLPHQVSGYASQSIYTPGGDFNVTDALSVHSFSETHLALLYPYHATMSLTLEAGAGLSVGFVANRQTLTSVRTADNTALLPYTADHDHARLGPLAQVGISYAATSHVSLRFDLAYVHYSNSDDVGADAFDLGFSGLMIRPGVEWKF
jgi:opacity protein-like surface antigen